MNTDFNLKLHHIGVATKNIEKEFQYFEMLGYKKTLETFDERQKVKLLFIESPNQPRLELVQNMENSIAPPLRDFLAKGIKFYHFAYETDNIEKDFECFVKEKGAMVICPIVEANCFEKLCFLMLKNMLLIELVQLRKPI